MPRVRGRPPHPDVLTPAEWEVLDWLRHGVTHRQVAERRGTSSAAVKYHVRNIAGKLGVEGTAALRHWPGVPRSSARIDQRRPSMTDSPTLGAIGQIALLVRDIPATEAFYRETLGLRHLFTFGDLTFFEAGGTRLFLRAVAADEWRPGSTLYFRVDEIARAHDALTRRGVRFQGAPHLIHRHDDGTEEWMAFFADPAGNTLALMAQVAPPNAGDAARPGA